MYRLDRLTSGLVIMGKNFKSTLFMDRHIKNRTAVKTYVCRVNGEFPDSTYRFSLIIFLLRLWINLFIFLKRKYHC